MRAFVDTNTTSNTQAFRDMRFTGLLIHDDTFLTISNRWAKRLTFIITFLRLTMIFF